MSMDRTRAYVHLLAYDAINALSAVLRIEDERHVCTVLKVLAQPAPKAEESARRRHSMTRACPFRFGVIGEHMSSAEAWSTTARQAEQLGYSTLFIRDHFIREPFGDQFAPMIALMAAADATKTLRVGNLVLDNDYRHPVMLAKEAATLDRLSGGRFELGIGAGWLKAEYEQAGMSFDAAGVRVSRLGEALHVLKGLFAGSRAPLLHRM